MARLIRVVIHGTFQKFVFAPAAVQLVPMLQLFRRLRRHPKIQSVFFLAHNPPFCGVARRNPLNRLHLWNSRRQPRVISSKHAPIAAPAQPLDTVRTAGCCDQEKRRFRRHPFILLSRRSVQNRLILPVSVFPTFAAFPLSTEPAALGFGRISRSPAQRCNVRFWVSGGYAPGCARKIGHSRDTRLTRADSWFPAAPVGTLPNVFGCVPAHIPRPVLQASARKTAG